MTIFKRRLPQPFPDPESDPEFLSLNSKRQTIILDALDRCIEMDRALVKRDCAEAIAERYEGTDTEGRKYTGLSVKTILNTYREWVKAHRDWRSLDKHKALYKAEAPSLERYNLTSESVAAFLKRQGITMETWAGRHNTAAGSVTRAVNGTRRTAQSQRILDMLAAEMRDEPAVLYAEVARIRADWQNLGNRIAAIEKHLRGHS